MKDYRALATTLIGIHVRFPYKGLVFELESWAHQQQRFLKVSNESGTPEWKLVRFESIYIRDGVSCLIHSPMDKKSWAKQLKKSLLLRIVPASNAWLGR